MVQGRRAMLKSPTSLPQGTNDLKLPCHSPNFLLGNDCVQQVREESARCCLSHFRSLFSCAKPQLRFNSHNVQAFIISFQQQSLFLKRLFTRSALISQLISKSITRNELITPSAVAITGELSSNYPFKSFYPSCTTFHHRTPTS